MKKLGLAFLMLAIGVAVGIRISGTLSPVEGQSKPGANPAFLLAKPVYSAWK